VGINDTIAAYRRENAKLRKKPCGCRPHFISTVKLAKELHVPQSMVRLWICRGLLPRPGRIGRTLVWSARELEEFYKSRPFAPRRRKMQAKVFSKPYPTEDDAEAHGHCEIDDARGAKGDYDMGEEYRGEIA
jgi:hypothetical protein